MTIYHISLWLVIGFSSLMTGWGLATNNLKAMLIGMVVALSAWIVEDDS